MDNEPDHQASAFVSDSAVKSDDDPPADAKILIKVSKNQLTMKPNDDEPNTSDSTQQLSSHTSTTATPKKKRRLLTVHQPDSDINGLFKPNPDMLEPDLREFENESKRIRPDSDEDYEDLSDIKLDQCFKNELEAKKAYLKPPVKNPLKSKSSFSFNDFLNRDLGLVKPAKFQEKILNSLDYLKRMKLTKNLEFHDGCVNALNFNRIGTLLASSSDDYQVCIWDWASSRSIITFDSGHKSNVFQVKIKNKTFYESNLF
jgi:hypothetical protein